MKKKNETFSMMVILLIPVAIAINIVGGQMTSILKIPVDLDMIGVILVGALAGPLPAAVTGVLTNLINGIFDQHGFHMLSVHSLLVFHQVVIKI